MLKQEGVYEHHCVWVPRNLTTSGAFQLPSDPLIRTGNDPLTPNFESIDNSLHSNGNRSSLDSFDRSNLPDRSDDVFNENRSPDDTADDDQLPNLESITSLPPSTFPTLPSSTLPDSTSSTSSSFSTTTAAPDQTVPPSIRRRRQIEVNTDSDIEPNITEQPDPDQPEDDQPTSASSTLIVFKFFNCSFFFRNDS